MTRGQCPTTCSTWSDCLEHIDPVHWLSGEVHITGNALRCEYTDVYDEMWSSLWVE